MSNRTRSVPSEVHLIEREGWHLDKRVPIALIFTIVAQGIAIIFWVASVNNDIRALKDDWSGFEITQKDNRGKIDKIAILETKLEFITTSLARLEAVIDKIDQRSRRAAITADQSRRRSSEED